MSDLEQKLADTRARFLGKLARLRAGSVVTHVGIVAEVSTFEAVYPNPFRPKGDDRIILRLDEGGWHWLESPLVPGRLWEVYGE